MRLTKRQKAALLFLLLIGGAAACIAALLYRPPIFCFTFIPVALLFVVVLLIPLAQPPKCPNCSQNLTDNISGRCPQCGQQI